MRYVWRSVPLFNSFFLSLGFLIGCYLLFYCLSRYFGILDQRHRDIEALKESRKQFRETALKLEAKHKEKARRKDEEFAFTKKNETEKAAAKALECATHALREFAKKVGEAHGKYKASLKEACTMLLLIEVSVVAMVALALLWSKMSVSQSGQMCTVHAMESMSTMAYYLPSSVSEPILAANSAMCNAIQGVKAVGWYLAVVAVLFLHAAMSYFGGSRSGTLFLLLVAYFFSQRYWAELMWRGPGALLVLAIPAASVFFWYYGVLYLDAARMRAWTANADGDPSPHELAAKDPAAFFVWNVDLPLVRSLDLRPFVADVILPVCVGTASFVCAYWLFCSGTCPYNVLALLPTPP